MGVWDPSAPTAPQTSGQVRVGAKGRKGMAGAQGTPSCASRASRASAHSRQDALFGESKERGEDKRAVFLSFLFN